jgi:NAD(P)-dependent dehydrogenase (short-subunit alcohol dehydrogenase family)
MHPAGPSDLSMRYDGEVAIVTGSGGGIGAATVRLLAERGARVVVNDNSPSGSAAAVAAEIVASGGDAIADTNTVATLAGGTALVATAIEAFGRVDIVVNNAATLTRAAFSDLSPDLVRPMLEVALEGAVNVTRPAWRLMVAQGYGRIIMTTSNAGWIGSLDCAHYGAAKLGLVGLTHCLALEAERCRPDGVDIRVNALAPRAASPMQSSAPSTPGARRAGDLSPAMVAPVTAWLAHRSCAVNGEVFAATAGRVARVFFGLTPGWHSDDLSPEDVAVHMDEICAEPGYVVPKTIADEVAHMMR